MKTTTAIALALIVILGAFLFTRGGEEKTGSKNPSSNVSVVDGVQIIEIKAKGGYLPRRSTAKAGLPTILRFNTQGTFDCSSSVRIPELNISRSLPLSGVTDIELVSNQIGLLRGSCSMGMYPFEVEFTL